MEMVQMWQSWLTLIIGIWVTISGLYANLSGPVNIVIIGLLALLSGSLLLRRWEGLVTAAIGLWLLICGFSSMLLTAPNFLISGALIVVVSLISMFHVHHGIEGRHKAA
jgi:hypothetical protein